MKNISFKIFNTIASLPKEWDEVAHSNHFLQTSYLNVLEQSAPVNMECFYIGVFEENILIGTCLAQYLDLNKLESFGERDNCLKTKVRNFIFKNFASHVLFLGNNMITGQNSFAFSRPIDIEKISSILIESSDAIIEYFQKKNIKIHIVSFKDFYTEKAKELKMYNFKNIYEFHTQPNMIFQIDENWKTKDDYYNALNKKYRDQYKRAHKKINGIVCRELELEEIIRFESKIYQLYHYVAKNAPFNTFFLNEHHFSTFKRQCGNRFKVFGYFLNANLVGFHSLLLNGVVLETYFLGYDETVQKENMLYLNMLYNMTKFGIENQFEKIIFGRTALEIKSSIGANPIQMSGFILHTNSFINKYIARIFNSLEPEVNWQQRHPFK
ncbi:8-amino-7-oxononanoate synthase [Flavobacterium chuncheonense]|uniref:8-amino-7-oxononanoate synthase n=1 Tax=Flavobacterium chuncheonense TaxID=2026653 RepID=A0ABW5YL35_9FLAO